MANKKSSGGSGKGILIAVIIVLLLILVSVIRKHPVVGIVLLVLVLAAAAVFFVFRSKMKAGSPAASDASTPPVKTNPISGSDVQNRVRSILPAIYHDNLLAYHYDERMYIPDDVDSELLRDNSGKSLTFELEPENPYDEKAVLICLDDKKLGYVYKGMVQDMLHDWKLREEPVCGILNTYSIPERKATYEIGFYRSIDRYVSKTFPIVKITKTDEPYGGSRFDMLQLCSVGDVLQITDSIDDALLVTDIDGNEIGELSGAGADYYREHSGSIVTCALTELDVDSDDKVTAKVTIYLK